jgi:hypothetical protein
VWADDCVTPSGGGRIVTGPVSDKGTAQFSFSGAITPFGALDGDGFVIFFPNGDFNAIALLEAPDGSYLFVVTSGTFTSLNTYDETITIVGGTGQFKWASGTIEVEGTIAPDGTQTDKVVGGCVRRR